MVRVILDDRDGYLTMSESSMNGKRTFPPLYKSGGNESMDRLVFFHILERLKVWMVSVFPKTSTGRLSLVDSETHWMGRP